MAALVMVCTPPASSSQGSQDQLTTSLVSTSKDQDGSFRMGGRGVGGPESGRQGPTTRPGAGRAGNWGQVEPGWAPRALTLCPPGAWHLEPGSQEIPQLGTDRGSML